MLECERKKKHVVKNVVDEIVFDVRWLHSTLKLLNALTKLFACQTVAFNFERSDTLTNLFNDKSIWFYRFNRCVLKIVSNRWNFEITVSYNRQQISLTRCILKIVVNQIVFRKDAAVWSMHSIALINMNSLRRVEFRVSNAAIIITDQNISWWTELILEGVSYVAFMWSLWITWRPELAISIGTYIWAVCSSKRKSHAIRLNSVGNKTRILYQQKQTWKKIW